MKYIRVKPLVLLTTLFWFVGASAEGIAIEPGWAPGSISFPSLKTILLTSPDEVLFVDVRRPDEYERGAIRSAINIPIDDLEQRVDDIPAGKPVVFICASGKRAGEAYDLAVLFRPDLEMYYLEAKVIYFVDWTFKITPNKRPDPKKGDKKA